MRIAYIVPSLGPLGPVIVVRNLVEQMVAHGHECRVFYFDERADAMAFACATQRISFWKNTDFEGFDWVHAHSLRPMAYVAWRCRSPKMVTMHSYLFKELRYSRGVVASWVLGNIFMRVARWFDRVVVLSHDAREYYRRWIPAERLAVCYNGVSLTCDAVGGLPDRRVWDEVLRFKGQHVLVGSLGELTRVKNTAILLRAMARLGDAYRLLLVGDGSEAEALRAETVRLGLADRVLFLGRQPEAHRYLPLLDVYAMTSVSEGFGQALVEAALYGRPIVCADIAGMREKFDADAVTYYQPHSAAALAEAITMALCHADKGLRARRVAEERFSTARMYEAYMAVYDGQ